MDTKKRIKEMTLEEKAALVSGTDFMFTNPVPRLSVKSVEMSDGPHGLRKQKEGGNNGTTNSERATAFPTAVATASSWNPDNTYKMGQAIAEECSYYGVNVLLGPGVNIKRNPRAGRNFEYFSEDPYLAGKMGAAEVKGVQSKGVGACVKHFALNNAEDYRFMGNSVCDERAMREIYFKPFEIVVKDARPATIMCAYNRINGTYCSQNSRLLNDVLRKEWGFDGVVMTDWGAMHDRVASLKAGLDLEMPGDTAICRKWILDGVKDGTLSEEVLDKAVENILNLIAKFEDAERAGNGNFEAHHKLAADIAEDCAVLLKNDGSLPLEREERLLVVGDLFEKMRYQGAGSSMINPAFLTSPKDAFDGHSVSYEFVRGYAENKTEPQEELIEEAVQRASGYDKILLFAGLTDYVESEGADRENIMLPENQLALINALIKTGKKIVVVLFGGSVIELPFEDSVGAILNMFLPGQNGGTAAYNLLFGMKTPCGKLAETWVKSYGDVPFGAAFSRNAQEVYKESIYVGYRYYLTAKKQVRYPFGYGLSYTNFVYSAQKCDRIGEKYVISCTVKNVGEYDGAEIVQLYVKAPGANVFKPEKELRAFTKIYLKAGEDGTAELSFDADELRYWNIAESRWVLEGGEYEFQISSDCQTVQLAETVKIDGEASVSPYTGNVQKAYGEFSGITDGVFEEMSGTVIPALPPKKPVTLESRFSDLKNGGLMGKILHGAVLSVANKQMKKAKKMKACAEKDNAIKGAIFLKRILESNSLMSMSMCAGKSMPYNFAQGFAELSNGHLIKGIKCFCTRIEVPELPKNKEEK